jgi:hypothetical protein
MEMSGQLHVPAALPTVLTHRPRGGSDAVKKGKMFLPVRGIESYSGSAPFNIQVLNINLHKTFNLLFALCCMEKFK